MMTNILNALGIQGNSIAPLVLWFVETAEDLKPKPVYSALHFVADGNPFNLLVVGIRQQMVLEQTQNAQWCFFVNMLNLLCRMYGNVYIGLVYDKPEVYKFYQNYIHLDFHWVETLDNWKQRWYHNSGSEKTDNNFALGGI